MASSQEMRYCRLCDHPTLHTGPATSHVLHFLLALVTGGLWLIVWVFMPSHNAAKMRCTVCGRTRAEAAPAGQSSLLLGVVLTLLGVVPLGGALFSHDGPWWIGGALVVLGLLLVVVGLSARNGGRRQPSVAR